MNFLIDAMLPPGISSLLKSYNHDSIHTKDLPLKNLTSDSFINDLSIKENRVVVSKDYDFEYSIRVNSLPYKLLLITTGNISNKELLQIFENNIELIIQSLGSYKFIEMNNKGIIQYF